MSNRILLFAFVLGGVLAWAGPCEACCTPPYVTTWNAQFWVIPGYRVDLEADELNGVCLTSWQWYVSYGGHKSKVDEYKGCWGGNGYSVYRLWFDYVDVYNPYVYANSACSADGDDAVFTVAQMGFSPSSPFPYIPVNDDDDDENGRMDNHNQDPDGPLVTGLADDDLVPLLISVDSPVAFPDEVTLGVNQDPGGLQVWEEPNRAGPIVMGWPDYAHTWPAGSWSKTVYVEGMHASGTVGPLLTWYYFGGSGRDNLLGWNAEAPSHKRWTVVHVDMDMPMVVDDWTQGGDVMTEETTPGGFIPLDGWAELMVRPVMPDSLSREVSFSITNNGDGRIEVWNAGKTQQMTSPFSPTANTTCWVKGTHVSSSLRDITLCLNHTQTGFQDKIKLTAVDVVLQKCGSSFLPKGGPYEDNSTTMSAQIVPQSLSGIIEFELYDVSDEPGYCTNQPAVVPATGEDSDSWKDLQFADPQMSFVITGANKNIATTTVPINLAYVTVNSYDYGAYGKLKARAQIGTVWYQAHVAGGTQQYVRIPRDDDNNNIADNWVYNTGNASDDADTSLNNTHDGDGLTRYEEYRGVDIDGDEKVSASERLNPSQKDLFVSGSGFGGGFPAFSYGNAFSEAGIAVHDFAGTVGTDDRGIDVLVVEAYDGTAPGNSGNIGRSGPPDNGVRQWYWATQGQSDVGNASQYGSAIGYTRVYKVAVNNRFSQKPYVDNNTWTAAGVWAGAPNGILDSIVPEKIEDTDDDGDLTAHERDGTANPPHDDGDNDFDGDYPVKSGATWEFTHDLSPHDIDNDGNIELPLAAKVSDIVNDYSKDHVVMHTVTHEVGHSVGINGPYDSHCNDSTCLMYRFTDDYNRMGHFCNQCRGMIYIHNN